MLHGSSHPVDTLLPAAAPHPAVLLSLLLLLLLLLLFPPLLLLLLLLFDGAIVSKSSRLSHQPKLGKMENSWQILRYEGTMSVNELPCMFVGLNHNAVSWSVIRVYVNDVKSSSMHSLDFLSTFLPKMM